MKEAPDRRIADSRRGFTLVEVIVILAVMAILAGLAIPAALRLFQVTTEEGTVEEMANLKDAMIGDPKKLQDRFRSDFGFLGDIGCLPATLDQLLTQGSLLPWSFDSAKQAGAGWKGPYITGAPGEEFTSDQWGNPYDYAVPAGPCPLTATLKSNGQDGVLGTADDIILSIVANETTATVRGRVKDVAGVGLEGVTVEFYAPVGGTLTTTTAVTGVNGEYTFGSVPFGMRAVRALPSLVYAPGSTAANDGGRDISFRVINYSTTPFQINQLNANFGPPGPDPNYDEIRVNGNGVDSGSNFDSQQTVNLTGNSANRTIGASPAATPSVRMTVDGMDIQLLDTVVTGQGTAGTIELNNFNSKMSGTPFTVTLLGPSGTAVVNFTP